jgi:hypothetical protein
VLARYTGGQIGLPKRRGDDLEYLPQYLVMGLTDVIIGQGAGDGMSLVRIDAIDSAVDIEVITTAGSAVENIPSALFLLDNAAATLTVRAGGSVGVAVYADETSELGAVVVDSGGSLTMPQDASALVPTNNGDLITLHTGVSG